MGSTLALGLTKPTLGGSRDSCNGIRYCVIKHIFMELEAYKICERWATSQAMQLFQHMRHE